MPAPDLTRSKPPPLPAESICKYRQTVQFPRTVVQPFFRPLARLANRTLYQKPGLETHVVMCGFPRSGTTLCQLMAEVCVADIKHFGREVRGLQAARSALHTNRFMLTKRPSDVFVIPAIREYYAERAAGVHFLLHIRDPRAVLTSIHRLKPDNYYVPVERWRAIETYWTWAKNFPDTTVVRFEDLVMCPENVESTLTSRLGWTVTRPFAEYHTSVPQRFDTLALNGLRPLDQSTIQHWRKPEHRDRIRQLLTTDMPELPEQLIRLGYENDTSWTEDYISRQRKVA